jgi:hypothetical protein
MKLETLIDKLFVMPGCHQVWMEAGGERPAEQISRRQEGVLPASNLLAGATAAALNSRRNRSRMFRA